MQRHSQNRFTPSSLGAGLVALAALMLLGTGAAWGQFANDGGIQSPTGGWDMPYDECTLDAVDLGGYTDQGSCEGAGWNWGIDPKAQTVPPTYKCYYDRAQCRSIIVFGFDPGCTYPDDIGDPACTLLDDFGWNTEGACEASGDYTWSDQACDDGDSRDETSCVGEGHIWYAPACQAIFDWDTSYYDTLFGAGWVAAKHSRNNINYRNDCMACHNNRHYSANTHAPERGNGETIAKQGHKNMLRPVEPAVPNVDDPHYDWGLPWAGADGTPYPSDSNGRFINWSTGQIDTDSNSVADTNLLWIYDGWIGALPRSHFGTANYTCGRCHSTGWEETAADETVKQPYLMFGDADPGGNVVGSWDQWGIQCSRCHGSRLVRVDGDSDSIPATVEGDLRHHPNLEPGKQVTTGSYPNEEWCNADGFSWNDTDDLCDDGLVTVETCEAAGWEWDTEDGVCVIEMVADGATRTNLCMDCHRQEDGVGDPMDPAAPGINLKVGDAHGHLGFVSHAGGNEFLNSPHGRFGGTFADIGDFSQWDTHFDEEGGCTGCHNVHESTVEAANPDGGQFTEECMDCHNKDLSKIRHPWSKDTPLANAATDPMESCEACHMPEGLHLFRISVDPSYDTFPLAAYSGGTHNANTADEDGFPAVWVDLDFACGQCHGGGSEYVLTSGDITSGTDELIVPDGTPFAIGDPVEIHGAGGGGSDLHSFVRDVSGNSVFLYGNAGTTVAGAEVRQNPPSHGAGYISKERLAVLAEGIHGDAPIANFTYAFDGLDTMTILLSAASSSCSGSYLNCDRFSWDCGGGVLDTAAPFAAHEASCTYASPGKKTITLTATEYGVGSGSKSKVVNAIATDFPPTIAAECSWDADTWTMTVTDLGSSDDHAIVQGAVNWGGGIAPTVQSPPFAPFVHTYILPGVYTVQYQVKDTVGQLGSFFCPPEELAAPSFFSIAGVVHATDHSTTLANVRIVVLDGGSVVQTVWTNAAGEFAVHNLAPATYTLFPTLSGYGFTTTDVPVGPSDLAVDIDATSDPRLAPKSNNGKKPDKPTKSSRVKGR